MSSFSVSFVGDFCSTTPEKIEIDSNIKCILNECNCNVLNFEGPLVDNMFCAPNNTKLKQSDDAPLWCVDNGFNIISLANNHMLDYGTNGLLRTKAAFKKVAVIGAGSWDEAYSPYFIYDETSNIKIGFLSFSSADLASLQDFYTENNSIGCAWINHTSVNRIVKDTKNKCDFLLIVVHAGVEYMEVPLPEWRDRYKELVDLGADAIIASHPHVPQGWELYNNKPIFYSLGNFFFDYFNKTGKPDKWDNGLMVKLTLSKDFGVRYSVYSTVKDEQRISLDMRESINEYNNKLCSILMDETKYIERVNSEILRLAPKYRDWLISGLGAIENTKKNFKSILKNIYRSVVRSHSNNRIALHQLREESTRYALIRYLKINN